MQQTILPTSFQVSQSNQKLFILLGFQSSFPHRSFKSLLGYSSFVSISIKTNWNLVHVCILITHISLPGSSSLQFHTSVRSAVSTHPISWDGKGKKMRMRWSFLYSTRLFNQQRLLHIWNKFRFGIALFMKFHMGIHKCMYIGKAWHDLLALLFIDTKNIKYFHLSFSVYTLQL